MNGDSYYTIGSTHEVCQDYAMVKSNRVFLADGCSSSPDTDVGARIVAWTAAHWKTDIDPHWLACEIEKSTHGMLLPKGTTDATLLIADAREDSFVMRAFGDGFVVARDRDGFIHITRISYPTDAPLYLSYWADVPRWETYKEKFGTLRIADYRILTPDGIQTNDEVVLEDIDRDPLEFCLSYDKYDLVLLFSDGAASFLDENNERVPPEKVIHEMLQIKNYKGEFIKRRAKRFLKDAKKRGWTHFDDFSVAALYHKEEADDDI